MRRYASGQPLKLPKVPQKQGANYSLDLGKEVGPYPPRDIMHDNARSLRLIGHPRALLRHKAMVDYLEKLQNEFRAAESEVINEESSLADKEQHTVDGSLQISLLQGPSSLRESAKVLSLECESMFEVLAELRRGRKQLKEELEGLQTRVNEDNQSNADNLLPLLRVLHQGIKASSAEVKSQFYQLQRELDQIRREHNSTLQQLLFVQKLVMSTEKDMGMARKEQWPI